MTEVTDFKQLRNLVLGISRLEYGWNQTELAQALGINYNNLSRFLHGKCKSYHVGLVISAFADISPRSICHLIGQPIPENGKSPGESSGR